MFLKVFLCVSPALSQGNVQQRFGQSQLLLLHDVGQYLSVRVESVGLAAQLKQLPDGDPQGPEAGDSGGLGLVYIFYVVELEQK